jgi:hypothetical protein
MPRGGNAALLRFDSAYIVEEAKVSEDARALIDEALDLLRKASNHDRWRCKERFQIDEDLYRVEQQLEKTTDELGDIASALKKGAERFAELEARAASQEGELNAELRKAWAFEADVWDPNRKPPGKPDPGIPDPLPIPDPIGPPEDPEPLPSPVPEPDPTPDPGDPDPPPPGGGDKEPERDRWRRWHRHERHRVPIGFGDWRIPNGGGVPIQIQPVPVWPTPTNPIVIYVPYQVSAQSGGDSGVSYGGASIPASSITGGGSGGYVSAGSAASPVTFSYPDSSGGSYGASSFGSSGFFSGGVSGGSGNGAVNGLLSMLLAWLTQVLSGQGEN